MGLSQLEYLYDFEPKKFTKIDRKFTITEKRLIVVSPNQCGISTIIFSHLLNYKKSEYLYIDFSDLRVDKSSLLKELNGFIKKNGIVLLVLENFDFDFPIPSCEEILITTKKDIKVEGFITKRLFPLDFEEFLAFEKKLSNIEQSFNTFANYGTYPAVYQSSHPNKIEILQHIVKNLFSNDKEAIVFKYLSKYQSQKISLYKIFKSLKEEIKISKDSFYGYVDKFQQEGLIIFLEKYQKQNSQKKLFLIDFALKNALTFEKDFIKRFENIVFSELYKNQKNIYYTDEIDFYLPYENKAILCIPFMPTNLLKNKIVKRKKHFLKLSIKDVQIITLGNEGEFQESDINYEIIPFWNWANTLS
ncbi:MAG: ATP-binding protein [Epsilonproteobacteria bacterium]|nr:ATP-binding protein [Campylobacterota bacterium]